jgi:endonuclease VIII
MPMPEGHTIHRIARDHRRLLAGRTVSVSSPQGRFADAGRVHGATLIDLEAYGKHLFHHWSTGEVGHIHLGLFGKFRVHTGAEPPEPRGAVRMRITADPDDGLEPVTIDLAGPTACSVDPPDVRAAIVARLGPDPLRDDADAELAVANLARSRREIGALLLDQSVLAGVGNVFRAEALFVHGIHPRRRGSACSDDELQALWSTLRDMLRAGVRSNRIVTVHRDERVDHVNTYVYKRDRCLRCATAIEPLRVANRTCYHCPTCQPH